MTWAVIGALALGTWGQRLLGMFVARPIVTRRPALALLADLLPAAIVAAVIAQLTVARGKDLIVDARLLGLAVAGVLVWRRAPLIVVVIAAAAATALGRAV